MKKRRRSMPRSVVRSRHATLGNVLGLGGAMVGGRLVRDLLYETRPFEPAIAVSVAILLATFGVVAMIAPAVRAGRIDPAVTLRTE